MRKTTKFFYSVVSNVSAFSFARPSKREAGGLLYLGPGLAWGPAKRS